jgi:hypothetical protein
MDLKGAYTPNIEASEVPVHIKSVKGRNTPTDPIIRERKKYPYRSPKKGWGYSTACLSPIDKKEEGYSTVPRAFEGTRSYKECERKRSLRKQITSNR